MIVEYPYVVTLEVSFDGGGLSPIVVDGNGSFYLYNAVQDLYYPVHYNKAWEVYYPNHYHDSHRYCGHHPLLNFFPSDVVLEPHMRVALPNNSVGPPLSYYVTDYSPLVYDYTDIYYVYDYDYDYDYYYYYDYGYGY